MNTMGLNEKKSSLRITANDNVMKGYNIPVFKRIAQRNCKMYRIEVRTSCDVCSVVELNVTVDLLEDAFAWIAS